MTMKNLLTTVALLVSSAGLVTSFGVINNQKTVTPSLTQHLQQRQQTKSTTSLFMAKQEDEDLLRFARQSRSAQSDDNVVELMRPLGLVLNADDNGNVYVETVAPRGNAARTGKVKEGDIVTMCSATFGSQMWSTRGVGLTRVLAAIRVRAGPTVSLVFESPNQYKKKAAVTTKQRQAMEDARKAAQAKKDSLLEELEADEKKINKGKFLGLF